MNCAQANKISIVDYLASLGIKPKRRYTNYWWYLAPHRQENNPSFKVNTKSNRWYDVGENTNGGLVDLVMAIYHTTISGALDLLSRNEIKHFSFEKQKSTGSAVSIKSMVPLKNKALIQYLHERCIPFSFAKHYLKEIYYTTTGRQRTYFSLAFENDQKGFSLRNRYSKTAVKPACITTIMGKRSDQLSLFEGVFDFLSALVHFKTERPKFDCIVLNSTTHLNKVLPLLNQYDRVNLFLDNDKAGNQTKDRITEEHSNTTDYSEIIYPNHKDFNEYLITSNT